MLGHMFRIFVASGISAEASSLLSGLVRSVTAYIADDCTSPLNSKPLRTTLAYQTLDGMSISDVGRLLVDKLCCCTILHHRCSFIILWFVLQPAFIRHWIYTIVNDSSFKLLNFRPGEGFSSSHQVCIPICFHPVVHYLPSQLLNV